VLLRRLRGREGCACFVSWGGGLGGELWGQGARGEGCVVVLWIRRWGEGFCLLMGLLGLGLGVLLGLYGVLSCLCEVSTCCDSAKATIDDNAFVQLSYSAGFCRGTVE